MNQLGSRNTRVEDFTVKLNIIRKLRMNGYTGWDLSDGKLMIHLSRGPPDTIEMLFVEKARVRDPVKGFTEVEQQYICSDFIL